MRDILKQTVAKYAESTGNYTLLNLLQRYAGFQGNKPMRAARMAPRVVKPVLTDQQRDYGSIISVLDKLGGRPAGTADLGKYRRRWLEYPPRDAASGHRNRLAEVLAKMVQDGVAQGNQDDEWGVGVLAGAELRKVSAAGGEKRFFTNRCRGNPVERHREVAFDVDLFPPKCLHADRESEFCPCPSSNRV